MERLLDSQNSIARRKKIHEHGFAIDDISLKKKKKSCEGLPDSQNPIVKRERVCEKGAVKA
jgi:hypothetical protein